MSKKRRTVRDNVGKTDEIQSRELLLMMSFFSSPVGYSYSLVILSLGSFGKGENTQRLYLLCFSCCHYYTLSTVFSTQSSQDTQRTMPNTLHAQFLQELYAIGFSWFHYHIMLILELNNQS